MILLAASALAQDFSHPEVLKAAKDAHFADGPAWSHDGYLVFSDTVTRTLHQFTPGKGESDFGDRPGGAAGNAFDADGRLYTCEPHERRLVRTGKNGKGKAEIVADRFEGKRLNAPNDIVVRRDGHAYFTDPAFGSQQDSRELDFYGIFHVTPKGELEAIAKWKTRPNGITLSPNGRILYVSDSDRHAVIAFDLDGKGAASNERILIEKIPGIPNGLRTDEKGNLYVAARSVLVYAAPQAGSAKLLGEVPIPETPSNLAFGDADLEGLYVTAETSVYRVRLGVKGALPY